MVDVGGGSVKLMVSGRRSVRSFETSPQATASQVIEQAREMAQDWSFEVVSVGYPGLVHDGRPVSDPPRLGEGWVDFDYEGAFECPTRIINDASLQALAAYRGVRVLFVGLGTGVGSTLITDDVLVPIELGALRFNSSVTLHEQLGGKGLKRLGHRRWRRDVVTSIRTLAAAFCAREVVLGGGNAARLNPLPKNWRARTNAHALLGAERLWGDRYGVRAEPKGALWIIHS